MNRPWPLAALAFLVLLLHRPLCPGFADITLVAFDPDGAAARIGAPAAVGIGLLQAFGREIDPARLRLIEQIGAERQAVPLRPGQTLVLKHRLWIHPGRADEGLLAAVWSAYAHPPKVTVEE